MESMSWLWVSLVLLLFQGGTAQRASIQGIVVKLGTGEAVSKAVVTISAFSGGRNQTFSATTGSNGQFAFQNLEPGQYRLSAARNGYVRMEYGARSPNRQGLPIDVAAGQKITDVVLQLMPAGTIAGRVFDRDGEPLANVNVQALRYNYQDGKRVLNSVQQARTNDLGEYRLFWLQPGTYYISATPTEGQRGALLAAAAAIAGPGIGGRLVEIIGNRGGVAGTAQRADDQTEEGYVPSYYPGTTDAQSAAPIRLPPGIVFSGVDLTVASVRTVRVRGQVVNGVTGQPARNANVVLLPRGSSGGRGLRPDFMARGMNQGTFEIAGVPPGSYDLVGVLNERNNRLSARMPLEIGTSDIQNVSLLISPGFTLTGRLFLEGQQAGAGNQDVPRIRVNLRPDAGLLQAAGAPPAAPVQSDGTFTIQQVGRDEYRLAVTGMPRNAYVKAARLGGVDVLTEGLRLDRAPTGPLEVLVSANTGIAGGIVQNERQEASANVTVVLVPDSPNRNRLDLYRTGSTNVMGRFHMEGVPPGDYKMFAWEDVELGAWTDPNFVQQFEDRGKPVRMNEGGTVNIELRVIPPQV